VFAGLDRDRGLCGFGAGVAAEGRGGRRVLGDSAFAGAPALSLVTASAASSIDRSTRFFPSAPSLVRPNSLLLSGARSRPCGCTELWSPVLIPRIA